MPYPGAAAAKPTSAVSARSALDCMAKMSKKSSRLRKQAKQSKVCSQRVAQPEANEWNPDS